MRRVSYKSVQDMIAGFLGWDPSNLSGDEQSLINRAVNRRLQFGWDAFFFPEWTELEQRTFRPAWDAVTTFAAQTEVYYPATRKYYVALVANTNQAPADASGNTSLAYWADSAGVYTGNNYSATAAYVRGARVYYPDTDAYYQLYAATSTGNLPTDATKWGVLVPFERNISLTQTGRTVIGDVKQVWNLNPRTNPQFARPVKFILNSDGVQVLGSDPSVWVEFRTLVPSWTGGVWSSGGFAVDDQVYYPITGDYYRCIQTVSSQAPTDAAYWTRIDLPFVLSRYAANGAYADVDGKTEGAKDAFPTESDEAFSVLAFEFDKLERQQQQTTQLNVVGC